MCVIVRVRSDAPRQSHIQSLSVTITNDQSTRSDSRRTSSPQHHKTSCPGHHNTSSPGHHKTSSSERQRRKRSSSEVDRQASRSTEKSKLLRENTSKPSHFPRKKSRLAGAQKDADSDDSLTVVTVQKRLSRAKTVRMYRRVTLHRDKADGVNSDRSSSVDNDSRTSQPTAKKKHKSAAVNGVSENKTSSGHERKCSLSVSDRRRASDATRPSSSSSSSRGKHCSNHRGESQSSKTDSLKSSRGKRHKTKQ